MAGPPGARSRKGAPAPVSPRPFPGRPRVGTARGAALGTRGPGNSTGPADASAGPVKAACGGTPRRARRCYATFAGAAFALRFFEMRIMTMPPVGPGIAPRM